MWFPYETNITSPRNEGRVGSLKEKGVKRVREEAGKGTN